MTDEYNPGDVILVGTIGCVLALIGSDGTIQYHWLFNNGGAFPYAFSSIKYTASPTKKIGKLTAEMMEDIEAEFIKAYEENSHGKA